MFIYLKFLNFTDSSTITECDIDHIGPHKHKTRLRKNTFLITYKGLRKPKKTVVLIYILKIVTLFNLDLPMCLPQLLNVIQGMVSFTFLTTDKHCHKTKCKRVGSQSARYIFNKSLD